MRFHFLILGILPFIAAPVQAQTESRQDVLDSMEECRAISVAFMRDACLQAADAFLAGTDEQEATSQQPAATSGRELAEVEAIRAELEKERAELEESRAALKASEIDRAEDQRRGILARLGLGQEASDDERLAVSLTIERITVNSNKIHTFYTSEGDRLVQTRVGRNLLAPSSLPATARLEQRVIGSKWLVFDEHPSRSYKVKVVNRGD